MSVTDANGQVATTEYDNLLRPIRVNPPAGGSVSETVYNDDNNNLWVKSRQQIDEQNWAESTTYFDKLGRAYKSRTKDLQGDVATETKFDNLGRVIATSNPYRVNPDGTPAETVFWSKPRYDELHRVVETYAPANVNPTNPNEHGASTGTVQFGISTEPNLIGTYTVATDASGRKSRAISGIYGLMRVDEATNKGGTIEQDLGTLASPNQATSYQYDLLGNLTQVSQGGQTRTFTYDSFNRIKTANNPESGLVQYTYDLQGQLKTKRDARGIKTIYDYDKVGRITTRCYRTIGTNGSLGAITCGSASGETLEPNTPDVNYYYDGKGLTNNYNFARGKLTKVSSSASQTLYTDFDKFGNLLSHQQLTDGNAYDTSYKYNLSSALVEQTYPSGKVVRNFFDGNGDLAKVVRQGKVYASDFSYNSIGAIEKMRLGNGNWESANFNERFQAIQLGLGNSTNNTTNIWKVNYEYGELEDNGTVDTSKNIGNIAKQTITVPTVGTNQGFTAVQTYSYDALNRLKSAKEMIGTNQTWKQTFNYDRFGNRSFDEGNTTTLPKGCLENNVPVVCANDKKFVNPIAQISDNRFKSADNFEYDAAGNMIKDADGKRYTYDALGKQTHYRENNNTPIGVYTYDGEGKRIKKTSPTENTIFVYDGFGSLVAEYAVPQTTTPPPNVSYLTEDTLGSPRIITGKNGEVVSRRDFLPFGEEIASSESNRKTALGYNYGSTTRQAFTGYEKDTESGLEFAQNRYYSNKLGRFTTPDPMMASGDVQDAQSWNRYAYVRNNPLNLTDPLGLIYATHPDKPGVEWFDSEAEMEAKGYSPLTTFIYQLPNGMIQVFNPSGGVGALSFPTVQEAVKQFIAWGGTAVAAEAFLVLMGITAVEAAVIVGAVATIPLMAEAHKASNGMATTCIMGDIDCISINFPLAVKNAQASSTDGSIDGIDKEILDMVPPVPEITNTADVQPPNDGNKQDPNKPTTIKSRIKENDFLAKEAKSAGKNKLAQKDIDRLTKQLSNGNMNPGIGSKALFNGIVEARGRNGGRVYFRNTGENSIEILAKSSKANQDKVINKLKELYGQ
jgi:RHS repeat-associated protein